MNARDLAALEDLYRDTSAALTALDRANDALHATWAGVNDWLEQRGHRLGPRKVALLQEAESQIDTAHQRLLNSRESIKRALLILDHQIALVYEADGLTRRSGKFSS